jgi:hypothetical protein
MKIILTNALDAGMPEPMMDHCRILLERRIKKTFSEIPGPGDEVTILYSDKDPLGQSNEVDDEAYLIYFVVETMEGADLESATLSLSLVS